MHFQSPEWFLLIPILLAAGWFWKHLRIISPLRFLLVSLIAFLLTNPSIQKQENSLDLYVLLDRSKSTESLIDQGLPEWKRLLEKAKPSRSDTLHFYNYASEIAELGSDGAIFTGSRNQTRTNLALQNIAALSDKKKPSRVLLFTDGFSTEPLHEATAQLQALGIPLDFRLVREKMINDYRVSRLDFPERTQSGEPFLISITLSGSDNKSIPLIIKRNGQILTTSQVEIKDGFGKVEFIDRINHAGSYEYQAEISPDNDSHIDNNQLSRWIEITGGPKVLMITRYADDPTAKILSSLDFTVDLVTNLSQLNVGKLSGARAVIINNVPAHEIPTDFLKAMHFYVHEQGGGFLMAGGERSFGSGGYFESDIDSLLPISMEMKNEHRKLAVALAVVMDRSGSMSVNVSPAVTKIDLANQGTANAINLLGQMDQVAVFAVDSAPETVIPMTRIDNKKAALGARVKKVQSSGGGIYVYEGLKAGWEALKKTNVGTRHLILFTDTADTEEPGNYKNLIKEMTDSGATISVIGLGTKADSDAALCEEIAKLGNGRMFFSDKPLDIPKIFAQETVTIARSSFIKDPVGATPTGRWTDVSPQSLNWFSSIDGYNLSYARPDSTVSIVSTDEYAAPLVATAKRGLGRTAAISFPLGGDYSKATRDWPEYANFLQTMTRWLMGLDLPPGIGFKHKINGSRLSMDLLYDDDLWAKKFSENPPKIRLLETNDEAKPYDVPWKRIAPGQFSATRDLEEGSNVKGALQVGSFAIPFGPFSIGSSIEWAFDNEKIVELRSAASQTGGRELSDLSEAWLRPKFIHESSLRIPIIVAILLLVLLEALLTRTEWKLPQLASGFSFSKIKQPKKLTLKVAKPKKEILFSPKQEPTQSEQITQEELESTERSSRYQRAKSRK
jgi:uncharacterized membrane protein